MKTLKFASHLVPLIFDGSKTVTWRLFDDKDLREGDTIRFFNKDTGEEIGTALIISLKVKTLGTLTDEDWEGHERYPSDEAMYEAYRGWYKDQAEQVGPDTELKILSFKFSPLEK